jgi:hypothetical protein
MPTNIISNKSTARAKQVGVTVHQNNMVGVFLDQQDYFLSKNNDMKSIVDAQFETIQNQDWNLNHGWKPTPCFHKMNYEHINTLYMGIELETEYDEEYVSNSLISIKRYLKAQKQEILFYAKEDCTLTNGIEWVSQPMTLEFIKYNNMKQFLHQIELANGEVSSNCGMHVHINSNFLGEQNIHKMKLFFANNSGELYKFSKRRSSNWCLAVDWTVKDYTSKRGYYDCSRRAISVSKNTTEIRIFSGTLDYKQFMANLELVDSIAHFVIEHSALSLKWNTFKQWVVQQNRYNWLVENLKEVKL